MRIHVLTFLLFSGLNVGVYYAIGTLLNPIIFGYFDVSGNLSKHNVLPHNHIIIRSCHIKLYHIVS